MRKRDRRLWALVALVAGFAAAVFFSLAALRSNISLYRTPSEITPDMAGRPEVFRLGGLVEAGSLVTRADPSGRPLFEFVLIDNTSRVSVHFSGVFPDLFREGQGAVARGRMDAQGVFLADEILAKHDENYRPPGLDPGAKGPVP